MQVGGAGVHDAPHTLPDGLPDAVAHAAEMQRVRVLVEEAREDIEQCNGGARQKRERLRAVTEAAAAALGQEHLDGSVAAAPATVADVRAAVETEGQWLEGGWRQGFDVCEQVCGIGLFCSAHRLLLTCSRALLRYATCASSAGMLVPQQGTQTQVKHVIALTKPH